MLNRIRSFLIIVAVLGIAPRGIGAIFGETGSYVDLSFHLRGHLVAPAFSFHDGALSSSIIQESRLYFVVAPNRNPLVLPSFVFDCYVLPLSLNPPIIYFRARYRLSAAREGPQETREKIEKHGRERRFHLPAMRGRHAKASNHAMQRTALGVALQHLW